MAIMQEQLCNIVGMSLQQWMSQQIKLFKLGSRFKFKETEVIIDVLDATVYEGSTDKQFQDQLYLTNEAIYFTSNNHLKKTIRVEEISFITIAILAPEILLHTDYEDVRLSSLHNIKIIQNILHIRQKLLQQLEGLLVHIQMEKSLAHFIQKIKPKNSIWNALFHKKKQAEPISQRIKNIQSFASLKILSKNFVLEIGKVIYKAVYEGTKLLFVSGNLGFIFNEHGYQKEQISDNSFIYKKNQKDELESFYMKKIQKKSQKEDDKIRKCLQNIKITDYTEQIYYAIETNKNFQIITPYDKSQKTVEAILQDQVQISELDLVSIFYKLYSLIENSRVILSSLSPKNILIQSNQIKISPFSYLSQTININYLAPEELIHLNKNHFDVEMINLWKIGLLIYQIAYWNLPFSIQYLAFCVKNSAKFVVYFPDQTNRSFQLQQFLLQILKIDTAKRFGGKMWKQKIFQHEWILKSRK